MVFGPWEAHQVEGQVLSELVVASRRRLWLGLAVFLIAVESFWGLVALSEGINVLLGSGEEYRFGSDAMVGEGGGVYSSLWIYVFYNVLSGGLAILLAGLLACTAFAGRHKGCLYLLIAVGVQVVGEIFVISMGRV